MPTLGNHTSSGQSVTLKCHLQKSLQVVETERRFFLRLAEGVRGQVVRGRAGDPSLNHPHNAGKCVSVSSPVHP